ncbi:MAG TPA: hypothetical protein VFF52_20585, partial [Isosphaeraceae bacterium]|nr:hypothetical protein [Isosphaeraceae bacterium]
LAVVSCLGLILAPVYMLRLFQGAMYVGRGEQLSAPGVHAMATGHGPGAQAVGTMPAREDLTASELLAITPLVLVMFLIGLYPNLLVEAMSSLAFALPVPWK